MFKEKHFVRKSLGVIFILIEMNLLGGTIFGFPSIFPILSRQGIYQHLCSNNSTTCSQQIQQYQNALTLGIAFFDLPSIFIGFLIDRFGSRFVKLISIIFHLIGWISLALIRPGRDYLIYIHSVFSSLSGIVIVITSYTSANYYSTCRPLISSLFVGSGISATMWFAVFQKLIDEHQMKLSSLAFIWFSLGILMFLTSMLFLDWKYSLWNLPYQYNDQHLDNEISSIESSPKKFYSFLSNRFYLLIVFYLSFVLLSTVYLSVMWDPTILFLTKQNRFQADQWTFIYNLSSLSSLLICPFVGFLLGLKTKQNEKRRLLNLCCVETMSWIFNLILCLLMIFVSSRMLIPILIFNSLARSTLISSCQSLLSTLFDKNLRFFFFFF